MYHFLFFKFKRTMKFIVSYSVADPMLGRVDFASVPTLALIELLVEGISHEERHLFRDIDGCYQNPLRLGLSVKAF